MQNDVSISSLSSVEQPVFIECKNVNNKYLPFVLLTIFNFCDLQTPVILSVENKRSGAQCIGRGKNASLMAKIWITIQIEFYFNR